MGVLAPEFFFVWLVFGRGLSEHDGSILGVPADFGVLKSIALGFLGVFTVVAAPLLRFDLLPPGL